MDLEVKIHFVATAEIGKVPTALQVSQAGVGVAPVEILLDGGIDGALVKDVEDRDATVLEPGHVHEAAGAVEGEARGQLGLGQTFQLQLRSH